MKLSSIENRIIELKQEITNKPTELSKRLEDIGVTQHQLDGLVEKDNNPLQAELEKLEFKRQFILDRRDNLFWKTIWNILVPILVSITTTYFIVKFLD